jgi:Protein of unknown function (DUF2934)
MQELISKNGDGRSLDAAELERLFCSGAKLQRDRIALLAHKAFVERGCVDGFDLQDWLKAEREIMGHR